MKPDTPLTKPPRTPGREYRYAMYNRPVWGGLSLSQPYTIDYELTDPSIGENREYHNRDAHSIIITNHPLTADEIRNLELVDIAADNKQRSHKSALVEYINTLDAVSDSGKRALIQTVRTGSYIKNKADVDKFADKYMSQGTRSAQKPAPPPSVPAILAPAPPAASDMASVPVRLGGGEIAMMEKKLAAAEAEQVRMKAINKIIRKKKLSDDEKAQQIASEFNIHESTARKLLEPDFGGRVGYPSYKLTNNNANIKRMKERVKEMTAREDTPSTEITFAGGTITDSNEDDRVQIYFNEMPDREMRSKLKGSGWHWSPSNGVWQRKRTAAAMVSAKQIVGIWSSPSQQTAPTAPSPLPDVPMGLGGGGIAPIPGVGAAVAPKPERSQPAPAPLPEQLLIQQSIEKGTHNGYVKGKTYYTLSGSKIVFGDYIILHSMGTPANMVFPLKLVSARNYYSTVGYNNNVEVVVTDANGVRYTLRDAHHYSPRKGEGKVTTPAVPDSRSWGVTNRKPARKPATKPPRTPALAPLETAPMGLGGGGISPIPGVGAAVAPKPERRQPAPSPLPNVPMGLGGGGISPIPGLEVEVAPKTAAVPPALTPAAAPKRKTAAKPATKQPTKRKAKKTVAKTTKKPKKAAAKPAKNGKPKKPAPAGTVLTAAQKKRLAEEGSVTVKRGGKFVTVTR